LKSHFFNSQIVIDTGQTTLNEPPNLITQASKMVLFKPQNNGSNNNKPPADKISNQITTKDYLQK
jgi:hypothetical protein